MPASRPPPHGIPGYLLSPSRLRRMKVLTDSFGDVRPLNSREKSIGRPRLPCCPRLRRMTLGKPETAQSTIRTTTDCFYLYEVPSSRAKIQVIGPRAPQNCLDHWDDEKLDVFDTEIENWVSDDLPKVYASARPVSVLDYCQNVISALVMRSVNADCPLLCTNDLCWLVDSPSRAERRPGTYTVKALSLPVLCVLLTRFAAH